MSMEVTEDSLLVDMQVCKYVAVYGTLRKGFHNNYLMGKSRLIDGAISEFWGTMYSNGGFPILSLDEPGSKIVAEIYEIEDERVFSDLDSLEGYPYWYNRTVKHFNIKGEVIEAWIYHQENITGLTEVESGDWKQFVESRHV